MSELFAVRDAAAERYIDPFSAPTADVALRNFKYECEREGSQFGSFPEDYALYHVGNFDPELGIIVGLPARKIAMASSFVKDRFRDLAMGGAIPGLISNDQVQDLYEGKSIKPGERT